jgi:periplasmic protein TonB
MTRNMFRDVIDPSIAIGGKRGYTVPLSIVTHTVIVAALIIIPLLATDRLPAPPTTILKFVTAGPVPTPPLALPPPTTTPHIASAENVASVNPDQAPLVAPPNIAPERVVEPGRHLVGVIENGVVFQSGLIVGDAPAPVPSSPAAGPPAPVRPGGNIKPPTKTRDVAPTYPPIAQAARVEGFVILEATIGPDGKVRDAIVLRSIPTLDAAALAAVRQWEYSPTLLNGVPVPVVITVTVQFRLR